MQNVSYSTHLIVEVYSCTRWASERGTTPEWHLLRFLGTSPNWESKVALSRSTLFRVDDSLSKHVSIAGPQRAIRVRLTMG